MSDTDVRIREGAVDDLPRIRALWDDLYRHQQEHGLVARLAPNGFELWSRTMATVLGRFGCLFVAEVDSVSVGFLAGRIRNPSPPFEATPVGFVSEVYVADRHRQEGIGRALLAAAAGWFAAQEVERLELQVLVENRAARDAYARLGWREELVQMVRRIGPEGAA